MSKVYIFLTDGFEEIEGLTVVDLLRRANIDIVMVSTTSKKEIVGSHQIKIQTEALFEELSYEDGDMLVLPGGPGTPKLLEHQGLVQLLHVYHENKKWLAAVCAAPSILGQRGILKGKNAICYPGFEDKLEGATIVSDKVVVDGNIITSKGLGTSIDFALTIIMHLLNVEMATRIAESIQYSEWN